ncbi:helix-turn-helix transcriptional regulator [Streptomyces sp. Edi4]|uniref:helix-turn-helix domain-containing protein n=1 Tax=Streptomyces sp. Edi4 TaxID=3162527 RepID=UPI003305D8A6
MATTESEQFAVLLRELKDRSGRSYGVLAGRLHMSTSTLHRYCNGDAVPTEYAPVDRLARLCGASPEESVELHRRWIVADEARRRARGAGQPASAASAPSAPGATSAAGAAGAASAPEGTNTPDAASAPGAVSAPGVTDAAGVTDAPGAADAVNAPHVANAANAANPSSAVPEARPAGGPGRPGTGTDPGDGTGAGSGATRTPGPASANASASASAPASASAFSARPDADAAGDELPVVERAGAADARGGWLGRLVPGRPLARRTRLVLIGAAVVAVAVPVTAVAALTGRPDASETVADARTSASPATGGARTPETASPGAGRSASPSGAPSASASSSSSSSSSATPSAMSRSQHPPAAGTPVSVGVSSYDWDTPCGKFYLLDQKPTAVPPPPPNEQDRRSWSRALGGIDGGNLKLELTATGKGEDAVVITGINVRVVGREAPLNWSAYSMGSGCGGGVVPQSFDIDLDAPQPVSKPVAGHQGDAAVPAKDFPFKVSTHDPEVFDLDVHTEGHDVSWYLEVGWSSGERSGKVTVNDGGKPFRTSAVKGRPAFEYNTDTNAWDKLTQE